ncbi:hypothetical protein Tco_0483561 [Tanacetum coccineum]
MQEGFFAQETKDLLLQAGAAKANSTNILNIVSTPVSTASPYGGLSCTDLTNTDQDDSEILHLRKFYDNPTNGIFTNSSYDDEGAVADFTNLEPVMNVSPIPTSRINSIHPSTQILGDPQSAVQTRSKVTKSSRAYAFKFSEALDDESWVDVMQEELLQFKIQKVWILVDLPYGKKAIGTKWVYRNKKDERGVVVSKGQTPRGPLYPRDVLISPWKPTLISDYLLKAKSLTEITNRGCQFLGRRLISWQCKKQTIVATSTTETEYVSAVNCCGQVLWIQNQMLDYGFNFMSTKIYIDNKSTICIVKNLVFHSKTKHIAIGHHFIRDAYEKKLIQLKSVPVPLDHFPVNALTKDREFWWNHRVIDQAKKFNNRKATKQIKKLKKKAKPVITHHRAWMKSKERKEKEVSTEDAFSTDKEKYGTDKEKDSTDKEKDSTDKEKDSTDRPDKDDETIAQVLLNMSQAKAVSREKEKGVELKDIPNDKKGKKKIEEDEYDTESEDINETENKFKMLAHDEEIARKMQEDWETEEERKRLAEEKATNAALIQDFDDIKARIEADRLLALRLQEEEREQFTMEERAKFLHDTIAAQRRFLAEQRAIAIRNRPPTRTHLRNQMMTYLKHVGNKKHSDLKNKTFEEIQALYEKVKRFDESFTAVGSTEDERKIKEMNEGAKDLEQKRLKKKVAKETPKKEDTTKVPAKLDVTEQSTKEKKVGTKDSEIMERKFVIARLNKVSSPDGDYLVIYRANGNFRAFNYLLEVLHIFDRQDLFHLYDLVMNQYSEVHN